MLSIQNLTKTYDGKNLVLSKLNLDVKQGELVAIVGSSGAGKSTLSVVSTVWLNHPAEKLL